MANDFFNASGYPTTRSAGASAPARNEFAAIATGFDKMPPLSGHPLELIRVKATGDGLECIAAGSTLAVNISGNAATATALQTARNINGVAFNGTADITVTAAAGTLTGAALAAGVTASSLTSVGVLTALTLSGAITGTTAGFSGAVSMAALTATSGTFSGAISGVTNLTTTANTILGDAVGDTLNVGAGGIIKDANGNTGFNVTPTNFAAYTTVEAKGKSAGAGGVFKSTTSTGTVSGEFSTIDAIGVSFGSATAHPVLLNYAGLEKARIDATGLGVGMTPVASQGPLQVAGGIKSTAGINVTGNGGFFNAANKFGLDVNGAVSRLYASGPNGATRGSFEIHVTDSSGALDLAALLVDASGNTTPAANNAFTIGSTGLRWATINSVLGNFSGIVTATGVAVGGALTGATTGTFSGAVSMAALTATSGTFSSFAQATSFETAAVTNLLLRPAGVTHLTLTTDGRLFGDALHNNAGAVTGTANQYIASGTYTPTFTAGSNVSGLAAAAKHTWIRLGNVVHVYGQAQPSFTTGGSASSWECSLPIASNFAALTDCAGAAVTNSVDNAVINASIANDRAVFAANPTFSGAAIFAYSFSYEVL